MQRKWSDPLKRGSLALRKASSHSLAVEGTVEQSLAAAWQGDLQRAIPGRSGSLIKQRETMFLRMPLGVCGYQWQICIFKNVMLIY